MSELLHKYGSRIKSIYLELRNYQYYHSPSEQDKPDKRFIGRREMRSKLKSIITQSETNSGTYLVTGFRGMGKTSLVNQVLFELFEHRAMSQILKLLGEYALAIWIASFFTVELVFITALFGIFLFLILLLRGKEKYITYNSKKLGAWESFKRLFVIFLSILKNPYTQSGTKGNRKYGFAVGFIRVATILVVANSYILFSYKNFFINKVLFSANGEDILPPFDYGEKFLPYLFALLLYFFVTILTSNYSSLNEVRDTFIKFWKNLASFKIFILLSVELFILTSVFILVHIHIFPKISGENSDAIWTFFILSLIFTIFFVFQGKIKQSVHEFVNHNEITPIRINLGKEKLSEEDILRLITYGLHNSYKKIAKPFSYFKRALWSTIVAILIYLIGTSFYFFKPTYNLVNDWRQRIHLTEFFPSQTHYIDTFHDNAIAKSFEKLEAENVDNPFLEKYYAEIYKPSKTKNSDVKLIKSSIIQEITKQTGDSTIVTKKNVTQFSRINLTEDSIKSNFIKFLYKKYPEKEKFFYDIDKSFWGKILPVTVSIDYVLLSIYNNFSKKFLAKDEHFRINSRNSVLSNTLGLHQNFRLFPRYDFSFFVFIILFFSLSIWIIRLKIWGVNHRQILSKLTDLVDNLEATISIESNKNVVFEQLKTKFSLLPDKRKEFPIKGAREIEIGLLEILLDIEKISHWRMRPRFVFIFDELDKIQPRGFADEELESQKEYTESEWTKRRQDTIGKILTNLKHFFNTAKAKFIFIAGREMYDAALADISDRDALIGSLFHDVIYVHSFYKDPANERLSDITSMTERYVCQFLIPEEELREGEEPSLAKYNEYLSKDNMFIDDNGQYMNYRLKVILALHDFIAYLSYRSNGAPKKITKVFEEYLSPFPDRKQSDFSSTIITYGDKRSLYLHFGYKEQYIFSVGRYLFNPFVIAVNKYIREFEDKLLVSTAFLLNHIYKFHKVGFSYKTLELTPEIIAIYKAPELRDFIGRLISFLNQTHIRRIISGLYDFKFYSRVEKEITFISKISASESAAFNFTLDESLVIKSIFRSKLRKTREYWGSKREVKRRLESISFINHNLGDLSFNDNQFFDAIHYFKEALLPFENFDFEKLTPDSFIFWIRTALKLGLSYEMIKNTNEALLLYDVITDKSIDFVKYCYKKRNKKRFLIKRNHAPILTILRLFYQSLLAKIQLIEKGTIKSLTKIQLQENIDTFRAVVNKYLEPEQQFLLRTEYYNKLGDLLFYKNGILFGKPQLKENEKLLQIQDEKKDREYLYSLPISGYKHYMISLATLINVGIDEKFNTKVKYFDMEEPEGSEMLILHFFTSFLFNGIGKNFPVTRRAFLMAAGNSLSDAGDSILILASAEINNKDDSSVLLDLNKLKKLLNFSMKSEEGSILKYKNEKQINRLKESLSYGKIDKTSFTSLKESMKKQISDIEQSGDETTKTFMQLIFGFKKVIEKDGDNSKKVKELEEKFIKKYESYSEKERKKLFRIENIKEKEIEAAELEEKINIIKSLHSLFYQYYEIIENYELSKLRVEITKIYNDAGFLRLHIGLRYIYIAAIYFAKAGDYKEFAFQMTKFLNVFRVILTSDNCDVSKIKDKQELLNFIKERIVSKAIRYTYKAYKNYDQTEFIQKVNSLKARNDEQLLSKIRTSTSAGEDVKEIILLYKEIELIIGNNVERIEDNIITPYINVSLSANRLLELNYANHKNYKILKRLLSNLDDGIGSRELLKGVLDKNRAKKIVKLIKNGSKNLTEQFEFVILDSIFSLYEIHKILQIFGLSYIHNHSWYASVYRRMGFWGYLFKEYVKTLKNDKKDKTNKKLEKLIGKIEINDLKPLSFYEKALTHAYAIYETHTEGQAYLDIIDKMNYLDDDFNDNLYHFSATMERMVINFGIIENYIRNLGEIIKEEKNMYYPDKYYLN